MPDPWSLDALVKEEQPQSPPATPEGDNISDLLELYGEETAAPTISLTEEELKNPPAPGRPEIPLRGEEQRWDADREKTYMQYRQELERDQQHTPTFTESMDRSTSTHKRIKKVQPKLNPEETALRKQWLEENTPMRDKHFQVISEDTMAKLEQQDQDLRQREKEIQKEAIARSASVNPQSTYAAILPAGTPASSISRAQMLQDPEVIEINEQRRAVQTAMDMAKSISKLSKVSSTDYLQAFGKGFQNHDYMNLVSFGIKKLAQDLNIVKLMDRHSKGDDTLTEYEMTALQMYSMFKDFQSSKDVPITYDIVDSFLYSLPFMAEIAISGSATVAIRRGVSQGLYKNLVRQSAQRIERKIGKEAAEAFLTKGSRSLDNITGAIGRAAQLPAQTAVNVPMINKIAAERQIINYHIGEDGEGQLVVERSPNAESWEKSFLNGYINTGVIIFSEQSGEFMSMGAKAVGRTFGRVIKSPRITNAFSRTSNQFKKAAQIQGLVEENLEEYLEKFLETLIFDKHGVEKDFSDPEASRWEGFWDSREMLTILGSTFMTQSGFRMLRVPHDISVYKQRQKLKDVTKALPDNVAESLLMAMDIENPQDRADALLKLNLGEIIDPVERGAVLDFIKEKTHYDFMKGAEIGRQEFEEIESRTQMLEGMAHKPMKGLLGSKAPVIFATNTTNNRPVTVIDGKLDDNYHPEDGVVIVRDYETGEVSQVHSRSLRIEDGDVQTLDDLQQIATEEALSLAQKQEQAMEAEEILDINEIPAPEAGQTLQIEDNTLTVQSYEDGMVNLVITNSKGQPVDQQQLTVQEWIGMQQQLEQAEIQEQEGKNDQQPQGNAQATELAQQTDLTTQEGIEGVDGIESQENAIPRLEDGSADYDSMEPAAFAVEYAKEFGVEETLTDMQGMIEQNKQSIDKLAKKPAKSLNDKANAKREMQRLQAMNEQLQAAMETIKPKPEAQQEVYNTQEIEANVNQEQAQAEAETSEVIPVDNTTIDQLNQQELAFIQEKLNDPSEPADQKEFWQDDIQTLQSNPAKYWSEFALDDTTNPRQAQILAIQEHYSQPPAKPVLTPEQTERLEAQSDISNAEQEVDTSPTEAQKEAGNYQKGHVKLRGMDISIENPKGSIRSGTDSKGNQWETTLNNTYGYFLKTVGKDKDHIDAFIGSNPTTGYIFIVDQINPETKDFDEHKVMLGFKGIEEARGAYLSNYQEEWGGMGRITPISAKDFKRWVYDKKKTKKPYAYKETHKKEKGTNPYLFLPKRAIELLKSGDIQSFDEALIHFFLNGGSVSKQQFIDHSGFKLKDISNLVFSQFITKDGLSMDTLYEHVNTFGQFGSEQGNVDSNAMMDHVVDFLNDHNMRSKMAVLLVELNDGKAKDLQSESNPEGITQDEHDTRIASDLRQGEESGSVSEVYDSLPDSVKEVLHDMYSPETNSLNWEKLSRKIEEDSEFFTIFPFNLNEQELQQLKDLANDTTRREQVEGGLQAAYHATGEAVREVTQPDTRRDEARDDGQADATAERDAADRPAQPREVGELFGEQTTPKEATEAEVVKTEPKEDAPQKPTLTPAQQATLDKQLADIDVRITEQHEALTSTRKARSKEFAKINDRHGLFGDTQARPGDLFADTFQFNEETVKKTLAKFDEQIALTERKISDLNKLREDAVSTAHLQQEMEAGKAEAKEQTKAEPVKNKQGVEFKPFDVTLKDGRKGRVISNEKEFSKELDKHVLTVEFENGKTEKVPTSDFTISEQPAPQSVGELFAKEQPKREVKPQPEQKIEDFGEKILGARKDMVDKMRDMTKVTKEDVINEPLSKVLPKMDYSKMVENGVATKEEVALLHYFRSQIPPKPRSNWKVNRWYETVQSYQDLLDYIVNKEAFIEKHGKSFIDIMNSDLKISSLFEIQNKTRMLLDLGFPESNVDIKDFNIHKNDHTWKRFKDGVETPMEDYILTRGHSIIADFKTWDEAIARLKSMTDNTNQSKTKVKLDMWRERGKEDIVIGKKVAAGKYITLVDGFKTVKEASAYIKENQAQLEQQLEKKKQIPPERSASDKPRTGYDFREGKEVTPEMFSEAFGFRGVQFGNYVEQSRRQQDLNEAYDALMDLAFVMNVPPKALSLGGTLGLAFGARGKGGKDAPMAHYEAGTVVINLTKNRGAGTLAHEWFHALDNYFEKSRGRNSNFVTDSPRQRLNQDGSKDERIRKEVLDAFKGVMDAISKSELPKRSTELDKRKTKDYWNTNLEMAARAFEVYAKEKLEARGYNNDYLVSMHDMVKWILQGGEESSFPFPTNAEMKTIGKAFDNLIETLQTKQDSKGNTIIFNIAGKKGAANLDLAEEATTRIDNLSIARELEQDGKDAKSIRMATGWERGADGKWRYETSDLKLKTKYSDIAQDKELSLSDIVQDGELLKAYPQLKDTKITLYGKATNVQESTASASGNAITISASQIELLQRGYGRRKGMAGRQGSYSGEAALESLLSHEVQHLIQRIEGFEQGTNRGAIWTRLVEDGYQRINEKGEHEGHNEETKKSIAEAGVRQLHVAPFQAYKRAAGEVEASNVENRLALTPQQRKEMLLSETQDVASKDQLFLKEALGDSENAMQREPLYANSERAMETITMQKGTAEQWRAELLKNGAKQNELNFMGFDLDFISDNKGDKPLVLTRQEVQEWIDKHKVELTEVVKGGLTDEEISQKKQQIESKFKEEGYGIELFFDEMVYTEGSETIEYSDLPSNLQSLASEYRSYFEIDDNNAVGTKFAGYTTPGGENYQERLLTMPSKLTYTVKKVRDGEYNILNDRGKIEDTAQSEEIANKLAARYSELETGDNPFKSSHWNEANVVLHTRFSEFTAKDGKRVLHVDEIQSDWQQEGRKKGFIRPTFVVAHRTDNGVITEEFKTREEAQKFISDVGRENVSSAGIREFNNGTVPDMPFKQTDQIVGLGMKRILHHTASNGFDRVTWTTGEQQASRYDLSKQVNKIYIKEKNGKYFVDIWDKSDNKYVDRRLIKDQKELSQLIGKDMVDKFLSEREKKHNSENFISEDHDGNATMSFEGLDLKVGGEGMKAFYDNILPQWTNKWAKKFGAKVGTTQIDTKPHIVEDGGINLQTGELGEIAKDKWLTVHSLDITPQMSNAILTGLPIFEVGTAKAKQNQQAAAVAHTVESLNKLVKGEHQAVVVKDTESLPQAMREAGSTLDMLSQVQTAIDKGKTIRGFLDPSTGKVFMVADSFEDMNEVRRTWIHEIAAHKGIRELIPDNKTRTDFLSKLYDSIGEDEFRRAIQEANMDYDHYKEHSKDRKGDEYLAAISDKILSNKDLTAKERSTWDFFVEWFKNMLNKVLTLNPNSVNFTPKEIALIVKASFNAVKDETTRPTGRAGQTDAQADRAIQEGARVAGMLAGDILTDPSRGATANPRQARHAYQEYAHNNTIRASQLEVVHGTNRPFEKFSLSFAKQGAGATIKGHGLYFQLLLNAPDDKVGRHYGNKTILGTPKAKALLQGIYDKFGAGAEVLITKAILDTKYQSEKPNVIEALNIRQEKAANPKMKELIGQVRDHVQEQPWPNDRVLVKAVVSNPDNETLNFLDIDAPFNVREDYDRIEEGLRREGVNPNEFIEQIGEVTWKFNEEATDQQFTHPTGLDVYEAIAKMLGSEAAASQFLMEQGWDGNIYADTEIKDGQQRYNLVVFSEDKVQVTGTAMFDIKDTPKKPMTIGEIFGKDQPKREEKDYTALVRTMKQRIEALESRGKTNEKATQAIRRAIVESFIRENQQALTRMYPSRIPAALNRINKAARSEKSLSAAIAGLERAIEEGTAGAAKKKARVFIKSVAKIKVKQRAGGVVKASKLLQEGVDYRDAVVEIAQMNKQEIEEVRDYIDQYIGDELTIEDAMEGMSDKAKTLENIENMGVIAHLLDTFGDLENKSLEHVNKSIDTFKQNLNVYIEDFKAQRKEESKRVKKLEAKVAEDVSGSIAMAVEAKLKDTTPYKDRAKGDGFIKSYQNLSGTVASLSHAIWRGHTVGKESKEYYESTLYQMYKAVDRGASAKAQMQYDMKKRLQGYMDKVFGNKNSYAKAMKEEVAVTLEMVTSYDKDGNPIYAPRKVNLDTDTALHLWASWQSESNRSYLNNIDYQRDKHRMTDEAFQELDKNLSQDAKDFANLLASDFFGSPEYYNAVNDVYQRKTGRKLPQLPGYIPVAANTWRNSIPYDVNNLGIYKSFTNERRGGAYDLDRNSIYNAALKYADGVSSFANLAEPISDMAYTLNSRKVSSALKAMGTYDKAQRMIDLLNKGYNEQRTDGQEMFQTLLRRFVSTKILMNYNLLPKQLTSAVAMFDSDFGNPLGVMKEFMSYVTHIGNREQMETVKEIVRSHPDLKFRNIIDIQSLTKMGKTHIHPTMFGDSRKEMTMGMLATALYNPTAVGDRIAITWGAIPIALNAYKQALKQAKTEGVTGDNAKAYAAQAATDMIAEFINTTQQSAKITHKSAVQYGGWRTLTTFMNSIMGYARKVSRISRDIGRDYTAGVKRNLEKGDSIGTARTKAVADIPAAKLTSLLIYTSVLPVLFSTMSSLGGNWARMWDDDDEAKKEARWAMLFDAVLGWTKGLFGVGFLLEYGMNQSMGVSYGKRDDNIVPVLDDVLDLTDATIKAVKLVSVYNDETIKDRPAYEKRLYDATAKLGITGAGLAVGAPITMLHRIYEVSTSDEYDTALEVGARLYGMPKRELRRIFDDPTELDQEIMEKRGMSSREYLQDVEKRRTEVGKAFMPGKEYREFQTYRKYDVEDRQTRVDISMLLGSGKNEDKAEWAMRRLEKDYDGDVKKFTEEFLWKYRKPLGSTFYKGKPVDTSPLITDDLHAKIKERIKERK